LAEKYQALSTGSDASGADKDARKEEACKND